MSENIYEEPDYPNINTRACSKTDTTYAHVVGNSCRKEMQLKKIQDSPGGRNHGCYKLAVVFLGLLCVLLLAAIIGLSIMTRQLQLGYNNFSNENELVMHEYKQVETNQTNMIKALEARNNNLTGENKQLQTRSSTLTAEKSQLETNFRAMTTERDELQRRLCKIESQSMKEIKRYAVGVTLDPDTAHPELILSSDGKQAKVGERRSGIKKTSKRFWAHTCVLGKQGFSSDKFYYEVQVHGKSDWDVGVARESINRNDKITLAPKYGYWTIWLRNGTEYEALADTYVPLSLPEKPQKVGVFVDYEAGLVSFYDADCWCHLYNFTKANFNGRIYPYFYVGGQDSVPIVIQPVVKCMSGV